MNYSWKDAKKQVARGRKEHVLKMEMTKQPLGGLSSQARQEDRGAEDSLPLQVTTFNQLTKKDEEAAGRRQILQRWTIGRLCAVISWTGNVLTCVNSLK